MQINRWNALRKRITKNKSKRKVIKRKGYELYVKWKGYNSSFNSWINKERLIINE